MPTNRLVVNLGKLFVTRRKLSAGQKRRRRLAGQSLVELAIFLPVVLIMLSGLVEFGFLLNEYLNVLDGPRAGARFAVDISPFTGTGMGTDNPAFYTAIAGEVINGMRPIRLNASIDDVVISVFSINSTGAPVVTRYPNTGHLAAESALDNTVGEWHLYGQGGACSATVVTCHPSALTTAQVVARVAGGTNPPNMGAVLVEVFFDYPQILKLPWLTVAVPDPIPVHAYTIMPLPAAEPH